MTTVLWISILLFVYPYLLYPLAILPIALIRSRQIRREDQTPTVTILIPAYNEVDCIGATIQNKLDQGYPSGKLQIIVISDGSTDGTDEVATGFANRGVTLLRREGREGKAAALNDAIRHARGDIVVFSDANSLFGPGALKRIAEDFADPEVGYITGSLGFLSNGTDLSGAGVDAYMRYENLVRSVETMTGSIIGVNGGVDAIRRTLYVDTPAHLITDFVLPLTVMSNGYRVIFDPAVTSFEVPNSEVASEFRMRVRVALRALQGLAYMRRLLNPLRYPMAAFCLVSHKILRYFGFVFMVSALISNIAVALQGNGLYEALLIAQIAAYALALLGLARRLPSWLRKIVAVPSYLVLSNAAFAVAAFRFIRGDTMATWRPRSA